MPRAEHPLPNLTLARWLKHFCPDPSAPVPRGRYARVMTFFLAFARGYANRKTILDYIRAMEPRLVHSLRKALLQLPEEHRRQFAEEQITAIARRIRSAISHCRRTWRLPIVCVPLEGYYVDLSEEPTVAEQAGRLLSALPAPQRSRARELLARIEALDKKIAAELSSPPRLAARRSTSLRAQRRWRCTPLCYVLPEAVQRLRSEQRRLLARLRALVSQSPARRDV